MWRSQVLTSWCKKIQTLFLFSKIAVFLRYREIYVHVFAIIIQHIGVCIAWGQCWIRVEPPGMVQPITQNLDHRKQDGSAHTMWYRKVKVCNDVNKMEAPFNTSTILLFCKLFEGIWNNYFEMTNKDGGAHEVEATHAIIFANSEGIWNNYVGIQQKIMQFYVYYLFVHIRIYFSKRSDLAGWSLKENTSRYKQLISDWILRKHAYTIPSD